MPRNKTPNNFTSNDWKTPSRQGLNVPEGYIMVHIRWRGCSIVKEIKKKQQILFQEEGNVVDFNPSGKMAVLYLSESDVIGLKDCKNRIVKLSRCTSFPNLCVIFEKTSVTEQFFYEIQKLVVVELNMNLFIVANQMQGAETLVQMAANEHKTPARNPFRRNASMHQTDSSILETTKLFPGVGEKKAIDILKKFGSIKSLTEASSDSLKVIGHSGMQLCDFINKES